MIHRIQQEALRSQLSENKIVLLSGPKGVGKMTLITSALDELGKNHLLLDVGKKKVRKELNELSDEELLSRIKGSEFIVIREAQYLDRLQQLVEWTLNGKIDCGVIISSSFAPPLNEFLLEALEQRGLHFKIYPLSFYELGSHLGLNEQEKAIESQLVYGNYPDVVANQNQAAEILEKKLDKVLTTQLGLNDRINKKDKLTRMLQMLAYSIGTPLSNNEIGEKCDLDNETVERYISLLEKAYILIKIPSFSTEKRYELKKAQMIYFVDNGIRNLIINNFNPLSMRIEEDLLWQNWLIAERIKWNSLNGKAMRYHFWRTHTRQSVDLLEQNNGTLTGYKFSWDKKKAIKFPNLFKSYYPETALSGIKRGTYWSFLTKK